MGEMGKSSRDKGTRVQRADTKRAPADIQHSDLQRDTSGPVEGKPVEYVIVRNILSGQNATLVQWEKEGQLQRGWIPNNSIDEGWRVSNVELQRAMSFGLPFHEILKSIIINNSVLADELRRRNVWTEQDVLKNPMEIARAIVAAAQLSASAIQTQVREFVQKQDEEVNHA